VALRFTVRERVRRAVPAPVKRRRLGREQDGSVRGGGPLEEVGVGELAAAVMVGLEPVADKVLVGPALPGWQVVLVGKAQARPLSLRASQADIFKSIQNSELKQ
jgi:hypothetical protein